MNILIIENIDNTDELKSLGSDVAKKYFNANLVIFLNNEIYKVMKWTGGDVTDIECIKVEK